ncbi:uncharacterized protein BDW43DRAFT_283861 [Aspergillus alliaceus]|uniref:uncharacterized protein n=1 Tax=Petromyces alliaceus TaxID=209559 RepID=UPI0012A46B73|nr:uncharacterized protein BDW43DRAFT_283861 [Aspergillus alliaceus]KAB8230966.1 hypothetical protein BDW43DRAFT_283861 [Aspergillus alliaceus]
MILIIIPIPMIRKLQMGRLQKIGLMGLFAFGCAIIRNIAANLIVLCASLPFLKQFLRAHAPGLFSSSDRRKVHSTQTSRSRGFVRKSLVRLDTASSAQLR